MGGLWVVRCPLVGIRVIPKVLTDFDQCRAQVRLYSVPEALGCSGPGRPVRKSASGVGCIGSSIGSGSGAGASGRDTALPVVVQRLPSKVSCLSWHPQLDGAVTIGDYDGVGALGYDKILGGCDWVWAWAWGRVCLLHGGPHAAVRQQQDLQLTQLPCQLQNQLQHVCRPSTNRLTLAPTNSYCRSSRCSTS